MITIYLKILLAKVETILLMIGIDTIRIILKENVTHLEKRISLKYIFLYKYIKEEYNVLKSLSIFIEKISLISHVS